MPWTLQSFVANNLPTIKAAWLNAVDELCSRYDGVFGSASTPTTMRTALGSTAVGDAVFIAADAAAARTAIAGAGSGAVTGSGLTQTTSRLLGRTTASTGAIEEISVGAGLTLAAGSLSCSVTAPTAASQSDVDAGTDTTKFLNSALNRISLGTYGSVGTGATKDFTGIPAGVRRVTINLSGVSSNGSSRFRVRIGPVAGVETSGYLGSSGFIASASAGSSNFTAGFDFTDSASAASVRHGTITLSLIDSATNLWAIGGGFGQSDGTYVVSIGGTKPLAGALSIVQLTHVNGTDVFDAGNVNISYER